MTAQTEATQKNYSNTEWTDVFGNENTPDDVIALAGHPDLVQHLKDFYADTYAQEEDYSLPEDEQFAAWAAEIRKQAEGYIQRQSE